MTNPKTMDKPNTDLEEKKEKFSHKEYRQWIREVASVFRMEYEEWVEFMKRNEN